MIIVRCSHTPSIEGAVARAAGQVMFINRLQSGPCIAAVTAAGSLSEAMAKTVPILEVGETVACIGGSIIKRPVLLNTPDIQRDAMSREDIYRHNENLWATLNLPTIVPEQIAETTSANESQNSASTAETASEASKPKLYKALLLHIHEHRYLGVRDRFSVFKFNGKRLAMKAGEENLSEMESAGLCLCVPIRQSQKGVATKFYTLTDSGYDLIGVSENRLVPSGGSNMQHRFKLAWIQDKALGSQHIKSVIEARKGGKAGDVGFTHNGLELVIEVCGTTDIAHELRQAESNLAAGWDRDITVFDSREMCLRAEERFIAEHGTSDSPNITICEFWHLANFPIEAIYNSPDVLFKGK